MVACINILYPENRLSAASVAVAVDGSAVSCFLRVSDHLESICKRKVFYRKSNFSVKKKIGSSPLYDVFALFGNLKGNWAIKTKLGD